MTPVTHDDVATTARPLRQDAQRNRQLIMDTARALFAEHGIDVGFDEIARHAGVGVGTVYRRFPHRDDLLEALFEVALTEMLAVADAAQAAPDPWDGFCAFIETAVAKQVADRGLQQVLTDPGRGHQRLARLRAKMVPTIAVILERAQSTGRLRADIDVTDVAALTLVLGFAATAEQPDLWRRYLAVMLDGLVPARSRPTPLPAAPPADESLSELTWRPLPRRGAAD